MPDVSIMVSAQDNFTTAINRMQQAVRPFERDIDGLQEALDQLSANRVRLQIDVSDASRALKNAQREYQNLAQAAEQAQQAMEAASTPEEQETAAQRLSEVNQALGRSQIRVEDAQMQYNQLRDNLGAVSRQAQRTQRDIENLSRGEENRSRRNSEEQPQDTDDDQPGVRSGWQTLQQGFNRLAEAGAVQMVGDAVTDIANTFVASAYGSTGSTMFSSALSGATSGAAIGTAIAPGVGTAVGALAGGAIGLLQGGTQIFQEKDEAFKSYVQESTENALAKQAQMLNTGTVIAAQRENDLVSFTTLFQNEEVAEDYLSGLKQMANVTPFLYDDLVSMSKTLKTFGYGVDHLLPTLTIIGDAGAALGMSTEEMNAVAEAIGEMNVSNTITSEPLDVLRGRGIDAYGYLAQARGVSKGEIEELISDGEISGDEAARTILRALMDEFCHSMEKQSTTMGGLQSTLEGMNQELANAMGEGYNMARKEGLQEQIDFLGGETGQQMQDAYAMIGEWKAELENSKDEMERDIMQAVMNGSELQMDYGASQSDIETAVQEMQQQYADAMENGGEEAGAQAGQVLARAQTLAISAYNASEGAQVALESELALAAQIRDDSASNAAFYNAGQRKGQEYSKGLAATIRQAAAVAYASMPTLNNAGTSNTVMQTGGYLPGRGYAFGLDRVPYDEYPALLHEGERVLTASQAREQDMTYAGAAGQVVITGNSFTVREQADISAIAAELLHQIRVAQLRRKP
nr:tape measure protein [uncultured Butyricicoccus sp.]